MVMGIEYKSVAEKYYPPDTVYVSYSAASSCQVTVRSGAQENAGGDIGTQGTHLVTQGAGILYHQPI